MLRVRHDPATFTPPRHFTDPSWSISNGDKVLVYNIPERELAVRIMRLVERKATWPHAKPIEYCRYCGSHEGCPQCLSKSAAGSM